MSDAARKPDDGRIALHACPYLVGAAAAATLLSVSPSTIRKLDRKAEMPRPVRLGRRVLWRTEDLREWAAAGCPSRENWEQQTGTSE